MKSSKKSPMPRRTFMKAAGAAFAAPFILPSTALGQNSATAPSERLTVGLIGCGGQGRHVMGAMLGFRDAQVLAVADVNRKNAREASRMVDRTYENSDCTQYEDYRDLLARDDIDAIICGTPDHWHALVCVEAARRGKHIYCEKPVTHDLREGRIVADTAKANNITFQVGSMQRSYRQMKQACQLVRNGYIGKVHHIEVGLPDGGHAVWVNSYPKPPGVLDWDFYVGPAEWTPFHPQRYDWNWRWWMKFGGSQMMDWIGHHGDIAHMGMGWDHTGPVKIEPHLWEFTKERNNLYDAPARYKFTCTYEDGTTLDVVNHADASELFRSCGDTGTLWYGEDNQWVFVSRGGIKTSSPELAEIEFKDSDFTFRRQGNHIRDFYECIKSGEEPAATAETGHRSASIGHLGKLACELRSTLKWDPANERVLENEAVNNLLGKPYRGDWTLEA